MGTVQIFNEYLQGLSTEERQTLERIIELIRKHVPEAKEGLSYGLPAFTYKDRPLIGFSSNKHGLNIYPFDPRIISTVKPELNGLESSKGVIRFTPERPIPDKIVMLMADLRLDYLKKQ